MSARICKWRTAAATAGRATADTDMATAPTTRTRRKSKKKSSGLLTRRQLALAIGVHMMTVTKWERDGMPIAERGRKGKPSTYREADVRAWLAAREEAAKKSGVVDVAHERARKERARAILDEQLYQARSRELLPAAEVEKSWNAEVQAVRAAILATYTTQADRVHRAAVLEGVSGVEQALKDMAYELLRELSSPERTGQAA